MPIHFQNSTNLCKYAIDHTATWLCPYFVCISRHHLRNLRFLGRVARHMSPRSFACASTQKIALPHGSAYARKKSPASAKMQGTNSLRGTTLIPVLWQALNTHNVRSRFRLPQPYYISASSELLRCEFSDLIFTSEGFQPMTFCLFLFPQENKSCPYAEFIRYVRHPHCILCLSF